MSLYPSTVSAPMAGCAWLARGRKGGHPPRRALAEWRTLGEQGFATLPGPGSRGAAPTTIARNPDRLWAISHLPPSLPTPHRNSEDGGRRGVKIHTELTIMSWRQGAANRGKSGRQKDNLVRDSNCRFNTNFGIVRSVMRLSAASSSRHGWKFVGVGEFCFPQHQKSPGTRSRRHLQPCPSTI